MKKLLILSNVFLLTVIIYSSCNSKNDPPKTDPPATETSSCPSCTDYSTEDFGGVPVNAAATMANLYAANHYTRYTINGSAIDSRAVWFSLDSIEKFIYKIKQSMCKCGKKHELGLRVYFGEYPDLTTTPPPASSYFSTVDPQFGQLHTLFMVPTYFDGTADLDFDPFHLGEGGCEKPTTLCDLISADSAYMNVNMMALVPAESKGIKNHGNLCPPLCPVKSSCFPTVVPKEVIFKQ